MRVDISTEDFRVRYRIALEEGDRHQANRNFSDSQQRLELTHFQYEVRLPPAFQELHPDLHAAAILQVLRPFTAKALKLPFPVSSPFAEAMQVREGIEFTAVESSISPRIPPRKATPCLLFSGGVDSMAASLVLPAETLHIVLDRLPHPIVRFDDGMVDLIHPRMLGRLLARDGKVFHIVKEDHEFLYRPYPVWHSEMSILPALYLADSLGLRTLDTGDIMGITYFRGYYGKTTDSWRFEAPEDQPGTYLDESVTDSDDELSLFGLCRAASLVGLSEVATARIVHQSPYRGKTSSCYYQSTHNYCMKCDKCFKKILLEYIISGREVPAELMAHFLGYPYLANIFSRKYFDWHHIWYYIFQRLRCRHWFARELQRQARQGPDLSMLEKWYPQARMRMPRSYGPEVEENILKYIKEMNAEEVRALEQLKVPPLEAPEYSSGRGRKCFTSADAHALLEVDGSDLAALMEEAQCQLSYAPQAYQLSLQLRMKLLDRPGTRQTFAGFEAREISLRLNDPHVYVTLSRRESAAVSRQAQAQGPGCLEEQLTIMIEPLAPGAEEECYFQSVAGLGIRYLSATPLDTPARQSAMQAFLAFLAAEDFQFDRTSGIGTN